MTNGSFGSMTPEDPVPTRQLNGDPGEGLRDERTSPNTNSSQRFQPSAASGMGPIFSGQMQSGPGIVERLLGVPGAAKERLEEFFAPEPLRDRGVVGAQAAEFQPTRFTQGAFAGDFRVPEVSFDALSQPPVAQTTQPDTVPGPIPVDQPTRGEVALGMSGIVGIPGAGRAFRAADRFVAVPAVSAVERAVARSAQAARQTPGAIRRVPSAIEDILTTTGRADRGQLQMVPEPRGGVPRISAEDIAPPRRGPPLSVEDVLPRPGGPTGGPPDSLMGIQREQQAVMQAIRARNARIAATNRPTIPQIQPTGVAADFLGRSDIPTIGLTDPRQTLQGPTPGFTDFNVAGGVTGIQSQAPASIVQQPNGQIRIPGVNQLFNPNTFAITQNQQFVNDPTTQIPRGRGGQRQTNFGVNIPRFDVPGRFPSDGVPPRVPPRVPDPGLTGRVPRTPPAPGLPLGFGGAGVFGENSRRRFPLGFVNVQSPAIPGTNLRILPNGQVVEFPDPGTPQGTQQPRDPVTGQFVEA